MPEHPKEKCLEEEWADAELFLKLLDIFWSMIFWGGKYFVPALPSATDPSNPHRKGWHLRVQDNRRLIFQKSDITEENHSLITMSSDLSGKLVQYHRKSPMGTHIWICPLRADLYRIFFSFKGTLLAFPFQKRKNVNKCK